MSLSLMTMLGFQRPTRHEKYVIGEAIKILRFNKYPCGISDIVTPMEKTHNKTLDHIAKELNKILKRKVREY